jgi:hypothetical protein
MIVRGLEAICWRGLAAEFAVDERQGQHRVFGGRWVSPSARLISNPALRIHARRL